MGNNMIKETSLSNQIWENKRIQAHYNTMNIVFNRTRENTRNTGTGKTQIDMIWRYAIYEILRHSGITQ